MSPATIYHHLPPRGYYVGCLMTRQLSSFVVLHLLFIFLGQSTCILKSSSIHHPSVSRGCCVGCIMVRQLAGLTVNTFPLLSEFDVSHIGFFFKAQKTTEGQLKRVM